MNRQALPPKRHRSSREPWRPPRDRKELLKTIGAGTAVVVLSVGAVLFLGRDHLGDDDATPTAPVPSLPAPSTPTTPATPDSTAPAPPTTAPSDTATTLPAAPAP